MVRRDSSFPLRSATISVRRPSAILFAVNHCRYRTIGHVADHVLALVVLSIGSRGCSHLSSSRFGALRPPLATRGVRVLCISLSYVAEQGSQFCAVELASHASECYSKDVARFSWSGLEPVVPGLAVVVCVAWLPLIRPLGLSLISPSVCRAVVTTMIVATAALSYYAMVRPFSLAWTRPLCCGRFERMYCQLATLAFELILRASCLPSAFALSSLLFLSDSCTLLLSSLGSQTSGRAFQN